MAVIHDTGYKGVLVSLGGVESEKGRGLRLEDHSVVVATGATVQILSSNPARKWAIISNNSDSGTTFFIRFGGLTYLVSLELGEKLLINERLPWTGAVYAYQADIATASIVCIEASVEQ